jgi:hypothetical protein
MQTSPELLDKIRALSPAQVSEVEDFIDFLSMKSRQRDAIDRLLAIAPALVDAGVSPLSESEIAAEIASVRQQRRAGGGAG